MAFRRKAISLCGSFAANPPQIKPRPLFRKRLLRSYVHALNSVCNTELGFSGGLVDVPVICPTCQNIFAGSFKRPDHATLHGVVLDIFVERPIHGSETMLGRSDSGQVAPRAQQRSVLHRRVQRWLDDASPIRRN
jgi:hypothetical protein